MGNLRQNSASQLLAEPHDPAAALADELAEQGQRDVAIWQAGQPKAPVPDLTLHGNQVETSPWQQMAQKKFDANMQGGVAPKVPILLGQPSQDETQAQLIQRLIQQRQNPSGSGAPPQGL